MPPRTPSARARPNLPPTSEEFRRVCALIAQELLEWPKVTARPMFGMRAFYRGTAIFAMIPGKRALERPSAIAYKLPAGESRKGKKWRLFDLSGERDIAKALARLESAYDGATSSSARRTGSRKTRR